MHIWLTQIGEHYPFQTQQRKRRTALLADALLERGHQVTWWGTNFLHQTKEWVGQGYQEIQMGQNYQIRLLEGFSYSKHVSLRRFLHYKLLPIRFLRHKKTAPCPDIIVTTFPDYDLSGAMLSYSIEHKIPIIVDIVDLWPDSFLDFLPEYLRTLGKIALFYDFRKVKNIFFKATSLVSCSESYLDWGCKKRERERSDLDRVFYLGYPTPKSRLQTFSISDRLNKILHSLSEKVVFTFVGTFGQTYDLDLILDAAIYFRNRKEIFFIVAGAGEKQEKIQKRAVGLENLLMLGWLNEDEIAALLTHSHVGLMTYIKLAPQSIPCKPFEYMAYGLALLSSLEGEMRELIEQNKFGLTYTPENQSDFFSKIAFMVDNKNETEKMGRKAKKIFLERFSKEEIYHNYALHIEKIAEYNLDQKMRYNAYTAL